MLSQSVGIASFEGSFDVKKKVEEPGRVYDLLRAAGFAAQVTLYFKNNRIVHGVLVFHPSRGIGRVLDLDKQVSLDFHVDELRDVKY